MAKKASFFKTWNLQMNKYLFIHKFQILKKICSRTCQQNMASFKNCPTPEGNFLPLPPTKKSHVKMASFKNCPHQKETILLQKKFKMFFFHDFSRFSRFFTCFLCFCTFFAVLRSTDGYPSIRVKFEKEIAILTKWVKSQINGKFKWVFSSKLPYI